MVQIAASLTGNRFIDTTGWTAQQGSMFIQRQVNKFFGRSMYPEHLLWDNCLRDDPNGAVCDQMTPLI